MHKVFLLKNPQARIRIEQDLRDAGLALEFALQGIDDLTWYAQIHAGAEPDLASLADALRKEYSLESVSVEPGYAVTAVAGEGLKSQKKRLSHILPALMDEGVEVTFTLFDATPLTALFGVRESDAKTVIHTVYDANVPLRVRFPARVRPLLHVRYYCRGAFIMFCVRSYLYEISIVPLV